MMSIRSHGERNRLSGSRLRTCRRPMKTLTTSSLSQVWSRRHRMCSLSMGMLVFLWVTSTSAGSADLSRARAASLRCLHAHACVSEVDMTARVHAAWRCVRCLQCSKPDGAKLHGCNHGWVCSGPASKGRACICSYAATASEHLFVQQPSPRPLMHVWAGKLPGPEQHKQGRTCQSGARPASGPAHLNPAGCCGPCHR